MAVFRSTQLLSLGVLSALTLASCVTDRAEPKLTQVLPSRVYFSDNTPIVIQGDRLFPSVVLDVSRDGSAVDDEFVLRFVHRVTGHEVLLQGVQWHSDRELSSVWPANQPGGDYELFMLTPDEQEVSLEQALTVSYSRASTIQVSSEESTYVAGEMVRFDIALVDALGASVIEADDVPVTIRIDGPAPMDLSLASTQGLNLVPVSENEWVANLSPTQENWLRVTSSAEGLLTVNVSDDGEGLEDGKESVSFRAGEVASLEVELPHGEFRATAGEPFLVTLTPRDEEGNIIRDRELGVVLKDPCGGGVEPANVVIRGSQTIETRFFKASGGGCKSTAVLVEQDAGGVSESFVVDPGEADQLLITMGTGGQVQPITAGEEVDFRVDVRDAYNNLVTDYHEALSFNSRTTGGAPEGAQVDARLAEVWVAGSSFWTWVPVTSGQAVLEVTGDELNGFTDSITVDPGQPSTVEVGTLASSATAGQGFALWVAMEDSFGNPVPYDPVQHALLADDGSGTVTCSFLGADTVRADFECTSLLAAEQVAVSAEVSPTGLSAESELIDISNSSAALSQWTLPASVTAGSSFSASLAVTDAYGNPFLNGSRTLTLSDDSGTLSPSVATLDADGEVELTLTLTQAGERSVSAQSLGVDIGAGSTSVEADVAAGLEVDLSAPWLWAQELSSLEVSGVDLYGNVVSSYSDTVSVSSESGLFTTQILSSFSGGVASLSLSWDDVGLQDRILLSDSGGLTGESLAVDVVQTCAGGPTAVLLVDGMSQDAVSCRIGGTASAVADLSASVGNNNAMAALHLDDGAGQRTRSSSTSHTLSTTEPGAQRVGLLAVDSQACAQLVQVTWYVADSGEPAGPVSVSLSESLRQAGASSALSDATVNVSATDCGGGPVTLGELYVRTDLGDISGVTSASQGLLLSLVSSSATATWTASSVLHNGTASVHVGTLNNSAYGVATLEVEGESGAPQVAWLDPRGLTSEQLDELVLVFDEDMAESSFTSAVSLSGPDGAVDLSSSLDGAELTLTLDTTLDASSGLYTLELSGVTDSVGNLLDGDWSGGVADFSSTFGVVTDQGLSMTGCAASNDVITPDGNAGSGIEADESTLSVSATGTPALWVMEVYDASSLRIRTVTTPASSSAESLEWDGRADDGRIVESGSYSVQVSSLDSGDNLSAACTQSVAVQHYFQESE